MNCPNDTHSDTKVLFSETQRFEEGWSLGILLILALGTCISVDILFIYGIIQQLVKGQPFGNRPMSDAGLVVVSVLMLIITVFVPLCMMFSKLTTQIKEDGVYVRGSIFNLVNEKYGWSLITKSYVRKYNPIGEYGGWGIRRGKSGEAYTVSGNMGLQLELTGGKKVLIGTRKAEEINEVLTGLGRNQPDAMHD
ncbi:MAG: DUF6141 family protein [Prevotellaceae bacterium]|jgi:hypothetical protein|nr:DUF6141 family protein [Prevotellaceae bacterium]